MSFWPKCEHCGKRYVRAKDSPANEGSGAIELVHKCTPKARKAFREKREREERTRGGGGDE